MAPLPCVAGCLRPPKTKKAASGGLIHYRNVTKSCLFGSNADVDAAILRFAFFGVVLFADWMFDAVTFGFETVRLAQEGSSPAAALNVGLSLGVGLVAALAGWYAVTALA
mgnify:CR=1 FL=1